MGEPLPQPNEPGGTLTKARHSGVAHISGMAAHITGPDQRNEMMETK